MAAVDLSQVVWDDAPAPQAAAGGVDLSQVKWDDAPAPDRTTGERIVRAPGLAAKGVNEGLISQTLGAVPDLIGAGMRAVGIPGAPREGFYTDMARKGVQAVTTLGGAVPEIQAETPTERVIQGAGVGAGQAASVMLPAAAVANVARAGSVTGNVARAMTAQPGTQLAAGAVAGGVTEATDSPIAGLAAGLAVPLAGAAIGRAVSPMRPVISAERNRLMDVARQEGIPLSPAQTLNSRPLRTLEAVFDEMPLTSGPQARMRQGQQTAFNRAVLSKIGVQADDASPAVLQDAGRRIGAVFDDLSARNSVNVTTELGDDLTRIVQDVERNAPRDTGRLVRNRVQDLLAVVDNGQIPGTAYRQIDSAIGKQIRSTTDGDLRKYLGDLRDALRNAMDNSIGPEDQAAWLQARQEYANLMAIRSAMNNGGRAALDGNISPTQLAQAIRQSNTKGFARGFGELNDLSRTGKAFITETTPNSGTPERTGMRNALTGGWLLSSGAAAAANPLMGVAALAGPRVAQAAYNNPLMRSYLGNQAAVGRAPELTRGLGGALSAQELRRELDRRFQRGGPPRRR